ncbi:response regulator [Mucilaginibacter gilvus]|uniref:Response regulator n=1 Tax=Mucilaginibacter gilvus TaxID=2305909 RepID=A0A3S3VQS9_9SPHI|nr:response regulator [Mucilaginibacter gilvus]RWY53766.1 response regulator [Mucilaginibacter gilvus]
MKKVLVIEDNNDIRENIIEILELAGYTVYNANNGKAGVELALKHQPDMILCDIMMPEMDGYGVLYILNKHIETSTIPFIFLTAKAEHLDLRKGMDLGADDYLTKPFDDMELLQSIESRLKKKELQRKFYSTSLDQLSSLVTNLDGMAELKCIINERKIRVFKKNQVVYYDGDKGNGLYLIVSGRVKTIKMAEDGRELMTGMYTAEDYLGINAILSDQAYSDTATAVEDSTLCSIPKDMLDQLLTKHPEVGREFIKLLAKDIREKEEQLLQLAYNSVRKKLADVLLRLYRTRPKETSGFKVSREDLAAMAGMATETVSRTLSDFKDERLIEKTASLITILDETRLAKMKN